MSIQNAWYAHSDVIHPPLFELSTVRPCKRCQKNFLSYVFNTARSWVKLRMAYCESCGTKTKKGQEKYINWLSPDLRS